MRFTMVRLHGWERLACSCGLHIVAPGKIYVVTLDGGFIAFRCSDCRTYYTENNKFKED